MKKTFTSLLFWCTLALNLLFGNSILLLTNKSDFHGTKDMIAAHSVVAVVLLFLCFRQVKADSHHIVPLLLGIFGTLGIPFYGMFIMGVLLTLPTSNIVEILGKGLLGGILFGIIGGGVFAIPLIIINTLALFLYRWRLQRKLKIAPQ